MHSIVKHLPHFGLEEGAVKYDSSNMLPTQVSQHGSSFVNSSMLRSEEASQMNHTANQSDLLDSSCRSPIGGINNVGSHSIEERKEEYEREVITSKNKCEDYLMRSQ